MNREEAKAAIEIIQASIEGKAVQFRHKGDSNWQTIYNPGFNFDDCEYRIKPDKTVRPYKSSEEFLKAMKEHGPYLRYNSIAVLSIATKIADGAIQLSEDEIYTPYTTIMGWEWQDGTKCCVIENK